MEKPLATISLNNRPYPARPALIDLNPSESRYYPVMVSLDSCTGSWNDLDDLSDKTCVTNKTENVNLKVINLIIRKHKSKLLAKHISRKWKCRLGSKKFNSKNRIKRTADVNIYNDWTKTHVKNIAFLMLAYVLVRVEI